MLLVNFFLFVPRFASRERRGLATSPAHSDMLPFAILGSICPFATLRLRVCLFVPTTTGSRRVSSPRLPVCLHFSWESRAPPFTARGRAVSCGGTHPSPDNCPALLPAHRHKPSAPARHDAHSRWWSGAASARSGWAPRTPPRRQRSAGDHP